MFVYLIVNDVNSKIYVGKTTGSNLRQYFQQKVHTAKKKRLVRSHLYAAIRKYGREHFHIYPLFQGQNNEEICAHEKLLIKALKTQHPDIGYNIGYGGEGFTGTHSEETRQRLSEISCHYYQDPDYKEHRIKNWRKSVDDRLANGNYHGSQEAKDKIKAARAAQDESKRIAGCRKYAEGHPEEMSARLSHEAHVLGGKAGSREAKQKAGRLGAALGGAKARHMRWHLNRGILNPACSLCAAKP